MARKTNVGRILGLRKEFDTASVGQLDEDETARNTSLKKNVKNRPSNLRKYLFGGDSKLSIVSSTPKVFAGITESDFGEEFYIHEKELEAYCEGFADSIIQNIEDVYNEGIENDLEDDNLLESALDDVDIKLSLYRSFKSLYDKWISNSKTASGVITSGYFFNNYNSEEETDDNRTLFDHFRFINRANEDIGGRAVIDISYLSNLSNTSNGQGPTQSLYNSLTNLLSKNNFDFWPLPSDTPLYLTSLKDDDIKDMFRANDFVVDTKNGPMFNCVHIGGSSRTVADISGDGKLSCKNLSINKYKDDSFDIGEPSNTPKEFLNPDLGVVSFMVRYGQEAQNHFQTLDIDQTEFKETQESLQIIDALTNPKTGSQPSQIGKGNSMYDVYLTRSYNCSVKGLGNMSIQPLMYFTLANVPMFRGTYLITGVKHDVTAHNHTTTFTGMRQPKITVPIVTDALSILDLALTPDEAFEGDRVNLSETYGSNFNDSTIAGFIDPAKGERFVKNLNTEQKNNIKIIVEKLKEYGFTQPFAIAAILAIISKESSFNPKSESFFYSAKRLTEVFPSKFPTEQTAVDLGFVNPKTMKADSNVYQKKIANQMYGNRYGNNKAPKSDVGPLSDDGWNFRGRGFNQLTFKGSYEKKVSVVGEDIFNNPDLVNKPTIANIVVADFMDGRIKSLIKTGKITAYGATNRNNFPDITNAVLAYYHCNTGVGESVAEVKGYLTGLLGGMKKAQERAPFLLDYIKSNGLV